MAKRYEYMDWLRVVAIFVVVGVHVVSKIINTGHVDQWEWQFANAIDSAIRWCVPVFFMLSGALLLTGKREDPIGGFLKRRLTKVIIPLIFWSGVYIAYKIFEQGESYTVGEMFILFFTDDVYYHLWFMYVIIGLYIMAPFLKILVRHMDQKAFLYFLAIWFIFAGLMPFIPKTFGFDPAMDPGLFQPYIGYFLLGAYFVRYPLPKKALWPLLGVSVISYFITVYGTHSLTERRGELDEFWYEHYRPTQIAISIFIFAFFQRLGPRLKPNPVITQLSLATLGIYVIHPLVQFYLNKLFNINETTVNALVGVPLVWILIFTISFLIIWLLKKVPGAKHIVP
ncbi:acyltransferase [Planococcus sp. CAU13]|uniref:acyltransferase n=1 Tax=Planococcus sp. CAU13 TaxID=1541197 RepID=UPI000530035C|nr:acyltransferase family protein [Planococcus sp. CAU13]